jgi:hypothetical protein
MGIFKQWLEAKIYGQPQTTANFYLPNSNKLRGGDENLDPVEEFRALLQRQGNNLQDPMVKAFYQKYMTNPQVLQGMQQIVAQFKKAV